MILPPGMDATAMLTPIFTISFKLGAEKPRIFPPQRGLEKKRAYPISLKYFPKYAVFP